MFIVGENLRELVKQCDVVKDIRDVTETCIELGLGKIIKRVGKIDGIDTLRYGDPVPKDCIQEEDISESGLVINPKEALLACSSQCVHIPQGYMGVVQTKGSLARMFVFAQCSDFQVDSGFNGCITFEFYNASDFKICIQEKQKVANLYILPTSDKNVAPYRGKYNGSLEPTIQFP